MHRFALLFIGVCAGCGEERVDEPSHAGGGGVGCKPGEASRDDGTCIPAGVPPELCGMGFVHDGERRCEPILPAEPCAAGTMAIPGESVCREVAPCAAGRWGEIPVEPDTEYVDATYAGGDSDASAPRPWVRIGDAIAAATSGAIVAIAAGDYSEDVIVSGKSLRLWGRCPSLAVIAGVGNEYATVNVRSGADFTEVHDLAIIGPVSGIFIEGAADVLIDRAWIHDTGGRGLSVERPPANTSARVHRTLIENVYELGVFVEGAPLEIEETVVRATRLNAMGVGGRGVNMQAYSSDSPGMLTMRRSLIGNNRDIAVYLSGTHADISDTWVGDTEPDGFGLYGRGIAMQQDASFGTRSTVALRGLVVERNHDMGIFVSGSDATIEATVVRDTSPDAEGFGRNLHVQPDIYSNASATLALLSCVAERSYEAGMVVSNSDASIDATWFGEVYPNADRALGDGLAVFSEGQPAFAALTSSKIEGASRAGLSVFGGHATLSEVALVCNALAIDGEEHAGSSFDLDDLGGNGCGCPQPTDQCQLVSTGLAPPNPVGE